MQRGWAVRLEDFAGRWRVERRIDDRLGGVTGRFEGGAWFRPVPQGLAYREEGRLRLGAGPEVVAVRDYLWREEGGRIVVDHADGRPFHAFDPTAPEGSHWCDPDDYRVRYDFSRWPEWRAEWTVRGPRKDYRMESIYTREGYPPTSAGSNG
ncbi:DUF6314 family protein [Albidovulum sp.]|uniref:DUF6314 family protein n=1 Tax=Albidovulum sp. TaxID=1872424 RepID=UPI0039B83244